MAPNMFDLWVQIKNMVSSVFFLEKALGARVLKLIIASRSSAVYSICMLVGSCMIL